VSSKNEIEFKDTFKSIFLLIVIIASIWLGMRSHIYFILSLITTGLMLFVNIRLYGKKNKFFIAALSINEGNFLYIILSCIILTISLKSVIIELIIYFLGILWLAIKPSKKPLYLLSAYHILASILNLSSFQYSDLAIPEQKALLINIIMRAIALIIMFILLYWNNTVYIIKDSDNIPDDISKQRKIANSIIDDITHFYKVSRDIFQDKHEIFYLSLAWAIYAKLKHSKRYEDMSISYLLIAASSDCQIISLLESPDSIEALSYYLIHKEGITIENEYESRFNKLISKIPNLTETMKIELSKRTVEYLNDQSEQIDNYDEKELLKLFMR